MNKSISVYDVLDITKVLFQLMEQGQGGIELEVGEDRVVIQIIPKEIAEDLDERSK